MEHIQIILMLTSISIMSFFNCRNSTVGMISEIGLNYSYDPKRYVAPNKKLARLFKIKQRVLPKYLYCELYVAVVFAILGPLNSLIYICSDYNKTVFGILFMIHICLIIVNALFFIVFSIVFKRK